MSELEAFLQKQNTTLEKRNAFLEAQVTGLFQQLAELNKKLDITPQTTTEEKKPGKVKAAVTAFEKNNKKERAVTPVPALSRTANRKPPAPGFLHSRLSLRPQTCQLRRL